MAVTFYMDQHVPKAIAVGLRLRGVDVMTAYEDGAAELTDSALLDRASDLRRVLFTQDDDLLSEAVRHQRANVLFHGVIYAHHCRCPLEFVRGNWA
jgi:predicted nuclease of predicted toxin-antitoxin system